jgi:hypothetical protein
LSRTAAVFTISERLLDRRLDATNEKAGDGARTHDPQLGKLMLYQLSYAREACILAVARHRGWPAEG